MLNKELNGTAIINREKVSVLMPVLMIGIILFLSTIISPVKGQAVSISAKFDTTTILIGEQTNFNIILEQPEEMHVNFPPFSGMLSEYIEILAEKPSDTVVIDNNTLRIIKSYKVTSFDEGEQFVEPIQFTFISGGDERTLQTSRTGLIVEVPEVDEEAGIYDIKDPLAIPVGILEIVPWLIILLAVCLILWYLYKYFRKHKRPKNDHGNNVVSEPPYIVAFRDLERLRSELLWEKGQVREYYTRLTEIVRVYIEKQFGVPAMEKTSNEIIVDLAKQNDPGTEPVVLLRDCFSIADLVKFARAHPGEEDHKECFNRAFKFVEVTTRLHQDNESESNSDKGDKELTVETFSSEEDNTNSISENKRTE